MGILDSIINTVTSALDKTADADSTNSESPITKIIGWITEQGGVDGIIAKLKSNNLASIAQSWLGDAKSILPISADQIQQVFGEGALSKLASTLSSSDSDVISFLSANLPKIVNTISQEGSNLNLFSLSGLLSSGEDLLNLKA